MRISSVKCYLCKAKTRSGYVAGSAVIRVETDDGLTGHGETLMGLFAGEAAAALTRYYEPLLIGKDPAPIQGLWRTLFDSSVWWGREGAAVSVMGAIENALWDIAGKAAGKPCYQLIKEQSAESLPVYASLGPSPDVASLQVTLDRLKEKGFKAAKIGLAFYNPDRTIISPRGEVLFRRMEETLDTIGQLAGNSFEIMVDGHMGGIPNPFTRQEALRMARLLEKHNVVFFEEPLSYLDPEGYAWLRERTAVRIAGGESLSLREGFERFVSRGALDIVQPDANFVGGVSRFADVARLAGEYGLPVVPHAWCGGPGMMANVHMAFAFSNVERLEMGEELTDLQQATIPEPPRVEQGAILPPSLPGMGIRFEPDIADAFPFESGLAERASGLMNLTAAERPVSSHE